MRVRRPQTTTLDQQTRIKAASEIGTMANQTSAVWVLYVSKTRETRNNGTHESNKCSIILNFLAPKRRNQSQSLNIVSYRTAE